MINLIYFTEDAYKLLKKDLDINRDNYYNSEDWLTTYFNQSGLKESYRISSIQVPEIELVYNGEDDITKNKDDLENTKRIYSTYKDQITPLRASNPLLWTALCHVTFKNYVLKRWKKDDGEISIEERFFTNGDRQSLMSYNAISRLWWSGYLTYDENNTENPWHLTETLFSAQQIQKDLFDLAYSENRTIVKGMLTALKKIQIEQKNYCTPLFRKCVQFVNRYGAVTILDVLSCAEIEDIAYTYMKKITNK